MRILYCGNCQASGLAHFTRRARPDWDVHDMPHLATHYHEFTKEQIAAEHAWADIVFYHVKHDDPQDYPTKAPKIPLSVWYQSAPFMIWVPDDLWEFVKTLKSELPSYDGDLLRWIVEDCDFEYAKRWDDCLYRMKEKEEAEFVPEMTRMSQTMEEYGKKFQCQLTCNHPTSIVFRAWTQKILGYLGAFSETLPSVDECLSNPNLAGLPCEQSATTGARKHLGLSWGGRPEDDESGRTIAREKLGL